MSHSPGTSNVPLPDTVSPIAEPVTPRPPTQPCAIMARAMPRHASKDGKSYVLYRPALTALAADPTRYPESLDVTRRNADDPAATRLTCLRLLKRLRAYLDKSGIRSTEEAISKSRLARELIALHGSVNLMPGAAPSPTPPAPVSGTADLADDPGKV